MSEKGLHRCFAVRVAITATVLVCVGGCAKRSKAKRDRNPGVSPIFARSFGGPETDSATGVTVDPRGNVFVSGETKPAKRVAIDPPGQGFILKYSPRGEFLWSHYLKGWSDAVAVGVDPQGYVLLTGRANPKGGAMSAKKYLTKFDGEGQKVWSIHSGGEAMAIDKDGNALVVGVADAAHGSVDLVLNRSLFIAKVTGAGEHAWVKSLSGTSSRQRIAVDVKGDVYVTGTFEGTADFGGGIVTAEGKRDIFIVKRAGDDGRHLWSRTYRGDKDVEIGGVAATSNGAVVIALRFHDKLTLGGAVIAGSGDYDVAVAAYTGDGGTHLWSFGFGGVATDRVATVTAGRLGSVVLAGTCSGPTCVFGKKRIKTADVMDAFVVSYSGKGKLLSAEVFGGKDSTESVEGVSVLANGDFILAGTYWGGETRVGNRALKSKGKGDVFVTKLDE